MSAAGETLPPLCIMRCGRRVEPSRVKWDSPLCYACMAPAPGPQRRKDDPDYMPPTPVIGGREEPDGCAIHGKRGCGDPADCCACAMGDSPCAYHEHFGCETEIARMKAENARLEAELTTAKEAEDEAASLVEGWAENANEAARMFREERAARVAAESRLSALTTENEGLREALRDIRDNFDCEVRGSKFPHQCQECIARAALALSESQKEPQRDAAAKVEG